MGTAGKIALEPCCGTSGTRTIHAVTGPLDRLMALMEGRPPAG